MGDDGKLRLDAFLPYRLSVAANSVSQAIADAYAAAGLKTNEWRLLAVLAEDDGQPQQALVGRTRMDKVSVSRAAQALEARGLVRRATDPADARSRVLSLSPAGRRLYRRLLPEVLHIEAVILAGLEPGEIERLHQILAKIEAAAAGLRGDG